MGHGHFFTLDRDWVITFANQETGRLLRPTPEQMMGPCVWDLFPNIEHGSLHVFYQRLFDMRVRGTLIEFSTRVSLWLELHTHSTDEGLAVHFQDTTQKRQDEAQLNLLKACVERMNGIVIITNAESTEADGPTVICVNEAFERNAGCRADEVIGKTPRSLQGPQTQRDALDRISARIKAWDSVREEAINHTKQAEEIWLELDIARADGPAGQGARRDLGHRFRRTHHLLEPQCRGHSRLGSERVAGRQRRQLALPRPGRLWPVPAARGKLANGWARLNTKRLKARRCCWFRA